MKKTLFLSLFICFKMFGQSVTILPQSANPSVSGHTLLVPNDAQGYNHSNGTIGIGTYVGSTKAYIQTHTAHSLNIAVNNGTSAMTISYSLTSSLNKNIGIGTESPQEKLHVVGNIRASSLAGTGNKQLYSDTDGTIKFSNQVAFAVHNLVGTGDISVANTNYFTVPFTTKEYDLGNNYNTSTYVFTAPVKGIYHFDAQVTWVTATNSVGDFLLQLQRNNIYITEFSTPAITGKFASNTVSTDIDLQVGDVVKAVVYQSTGVNQQLQGFDRLTRFSGRLVMPL